MNYIVVLCMIDTYEAAKSIARTLVESKLAACVNIVPQITSIYSWKGEIVEDNEFLLIVKSKSEAYDKLESEIKELHSYEVPEIIAFDINKGLPEYLRWIEENVK